MQFFDKCNGCRSAEIPIGSTPEPLNAEEGKPEASKFCASLGLPANIAELQEHAVGLQRG
jgi:hypothetical protein